MKKQMIILFFLTIFSVTAEDLTTNNGALYQDVTISKVRPDGLEIIHSNGISFIEFEDLSKKIQDQYNYDPQKAMKYKEKIELLQQNQAAAKAKRKKRNAKMKKLAKIKQKKLAEEKKNKIKRLKKKILQHAVPVLLTRNVLYKIGNLKVKVSQDLLDYSHLFPAYKNYMIVNSKLYIINNNIISAKKKLTLIAKEINNILPIYQQQIANIQKWEDIIAINIQKIDRILGNTDLARVNYYDRSGQYIGRSELSYELSYNQSHLVHSLNKENKKLNRTIRKVAYQNNILHKEIIQKKSDCEVLSDAIKKFNEAHEKYLQNSNQEIQSGNNDNNNIKLKLKKLKLLLEEGLISQEVYDKKLAELMDRYLN
jgi:hypothetical protein